VDVFLSHFLPLYPPDAKADLERARTIDANPGKNPTLYSHLDEAAAIFARIANAHFDEALELDFTDASVHRIGAALTPARRDAWASAGAAGTAGNTLFNVVVHGAAYVGACIVRNHGGEWRVRRPLWESKVFLRSRAGEGELAVFHWWLKSLSEGGATLADRYRAHVEVPRARPEALPVVFAGRSDLPRLERPSYATFHKYLRAHLPELRDLGGAFPSPERFDAFGLAWMEFLVLGGGRMLLAHARGEHGAHLFWLGPSGFEKAAFYPAERSAAHAVAVDGDKLRVTVDTGGREAIHEMLWWGP
jgi:hypothetical protein